jgi:nitrate/nitrite-specific signal transduction histidine kinase
MQGMAERASTIEAAIFARTREQGGTEIRLDVPIQEEGLWYR